MPSLFLAVVMALAQPLAPSIAADGAKPDRPIKAVSQAPRPTDGPESDALASCRAQCHYQAILAALECHRGGGSREVCREIYERTLADCLATCEPTCEELCLEEALEMFDECTMAGGSPLQCMFMAAQYLHECVSGCP